MKVLIDTNILIDFYSKRTDYYETAEKIMALCAAKTIDACIAAHSITNIFYILRKDMDNKLRRSILKDLCLIVTVIGIDKEKLIAALENDSVPDMEDCLQTECAKSFGAELIVTRNIKDYLNSDITAVLPNELLKKIGY